MKEDLFYPIIERHLERMGYLVFQNFPIGRWNAKRVDVIGIQSTSKEIISVEVKTKNFQRAKEQASHRLLFSDFVYLAFPYSYAKYVAHTYHADFEEYGFGLLGINHNVEIFIPSKRSTLLNKDFKRYVLNLIQSRSRGV